jgi:putative flippase GtrA
MSIYSSLIEFKRFILVGAVSTLFNYLVFYLLLNFKIFEYLVASGLGYTAGIFLGYSLNNQWTFQSNKTGDVHKILKYVGVYFSTLIISLVLLEYFVSTLGLIAEIANVICIIITTFTNFFLIKLFVFKGNTG